MKFNAGDQPVLLHPELEGRDVLELFNLLPREHRSVLENLPQLANVTSEIATELLAVTQTRGPARRPAAWVLLQAALNGKVLLPVGDHKLRQNLPAGMSVELPKLLEFVDKQVQTRKTQWRDTDRHIALLLATSCRDAQGFDLEQYSHLHDGLIKRGALDKEFSLAKCEYVLLHVLEEAGVLLRTQRHAYVLWRASARHETVSFRDFAADPTSMHGMRIHGHDRERVELRSQVERRKELSDARRSASKSERPENPFIKKLRAFAESTDDDAPEKYFGELTRANIHKGFRPENWLEQPVNYPSRPHVDIAKLGKLWLEAFRAYLSHRLKDYETEKEARGQLHLLADYLLLYLPWWMERHPETTLEYPSSPKQFLRYLFVSRTRHSAGADEVERELPKTLYDLLPLRRPTESARNTSRRHLHSFFQFVITYFEDHEDYVSRGMVNPIRTDFDNEVAGRPSKSNKIPFSEDAYPFLVHYGQCLEAFGEFLQARAYEADALKAYPFGDRDGYDTSEWGFVPVFWYRGKRYSVNWIPNLYRIARRTVHRNPAGPAGLYVSGHRVNRGPDARITFNLPHLTTVRLLNSMVEMGLRGQSMQWLDRRHFDQLAPPLGRLADLYSDPEKQDFHALYVNTDKSHDEWDNLACWRVRRSLWSEAYFQMCLADAKDVEVKYEDRENTRFLPILPLFRSYPGDGPISDSSYYDRWVDYQYGFEQFYNTKDGVDRRGTPEHVAFVKKKESAPEKGRLDEIYLTIHTPHACRTTYASLKDGDLEVSEVAYQLGHASTVTTNHYQIPNVKRLTAKLKAVDAVEMGRVTYDPSGASAAYLHAEREDSSVRIAFAKDRERAISEFGFVPGVALWSLSELDGDAPTLELLRQSPSSAIRWHPTHACVVGNQCPREVVVNTGGMFRCGICPLAAKCIDHLPAIESKQNELRERIRTTAARITAREKPGAPQEELNQLHREMSLDTKELLGWKLSAEILRRKVEELGDDGAYHVDQPELVRKQLQLVTRNQGDSEFFLQRISESNAYPSLESAEVRAKAARLTRLILARQGRLEEAAFLDVAPHTELTVFASLVKPFVDAKGLSMPELAAEVDALPEKARARGLSDTRLLTGS